MTFIHFTLGTWELGTSRLGVFEPFELPGTREITRKKRVEGDPGADGRPVVTYTDETIEALIRALDADELTKLPLGAVAQDHRMVITIDELVSLDLVDIAGVLFEVQGPPAEVYDGDSFVYREALVRRYIYGT